MRRLVFDLAVIVITALTPLLWFREAKLINGADINFPLDPVARFVSRLNLYDPTIAAGQDMSGSTGSLVFHGLQALLAQTGLSLVNIERVQFIFWFALTGLAFYFFLKSFERLLPISPLIGTIFWQFNPYRIATWTEVNVATLAALIFLPTSLAIFNLVGRRKLSQRWALLGLASVSILTAGLGLNPPILVVSWFAIVVYLLFLTRPLKIPITFIAKAVLTILAASAFWLYPTIASLLGSSGNLSPADLNLLDWVEGLSKDTSFWNVVRLQGAWDWYENWRGEPYITYAGAYRSPLLVTLSLVPAGLALAGAIVLWRKKSSRFLAGFALVFVAVGLLLSMGSHAPMRGVFTFLKDHLPYFWIFRSPWYKFTLLTVTGYGFLIAVAVGFLEKKLNPQLKVALTGAVAVSFLVFAFPLLNGKLFPTASERQQLNSFHIEVPGYVHEMAEFLNELPDQGGVVLLPQEGAFTYTWGYGSAGDITTHLIKRPVFSLHAFTPIGKRSDTELTKLFYRHLYAKDPRATQLLRLLNVRYLLHKRDALKSVYNESDDSQFIQERLALLPDIEFVKNFGAWDLWQLRDFKPEVISLNADGFVFNGSILSYLSLVEHEESLKDDPVVFSPDGSTLNKLDQALPNYLPIDLTQSHLQDDKIVLELDVPVTGTYELSGVPQSKPVNLMIGRHEISIKPGASQPTGGLTQLGSFELAAQPTEVTLSGPERPVNLVADPNFKEGLSLAKPFEKAWQLLDASEDAPGQPQFEFRQDADGAELTSFNHVMALKQRVDGLVSTGLYLLSFEYQSLAGNQPEFGTWQLEANLSDPAGLLSKDPGWQHVERVFTPDPRTQTVELYFYARGKDNQPTRFKVRNVRLIQLTGQVHAYFLKLPGSQLLQEKERPPLTLTDRRSTRLSFELPTTTQPTLLTTSLAHNNGWRLELPAPTAASPLEVNDYAAAYWLGPQPGGQASLTFGLARRLAIGSTISLITLGWLFKGVIP